MKKSSLGFGKLFNVLQSLIGRMASRPMRNIETFPSNQMYLCLSLVLMTYFHCFFWTNGVLDSDCLPKVCYLKLKKLSYLSKLR